MGDARKRGWALGAASLLIAGLAVSTALAQTTPLPAPLDGPPFPALSPTRSAEAEAALGQRWLDAYRAAGPSHDPRTARRAPDGAPLYVNRLMLETAPYLRQHAHNPVDWRPWGPEALAAAQAQNKPIFFSAGYSTCNWCHVMAAESFDDEEVAATLADGFIAVKIDREELPDVDELYMTATSLITGSGGWPNSVWMTPDGKPFFAATYLPREAFMEALGAVRRTWEADEAGVRQQADRVASAMQERLALAAAAAGFDPGAHDRALAAIASSFNARQGGFSDSVQFPHPVWVLYLLDAHARTGDAQALEMATATLDAIAAGGIHDHVGGGFHRYAVDVGWQTPHFEKMLYSQALIGRAFTEGWRATKRPAYARAARRAFDYVLRDMTLPGGAFAAAEDAVSALPIGVTASGEADGEVEGAFYAWSLRDLKAALGSADAALEAAEALQLDRGPRFGDGSAPAADPDDLARLADWDPVLDQLRQAREARPRPRRDDKAIAAWNGLAIRALAEADAAFGEPRYGAAAQAAAEAILAGLWTSGDAAGRLARYGLDQGGALTPGPEAGRLADYASLGLGLVALSDLAALRGDPEAAEARAAEAERVAEALRARFDTGDGRLAMAETPGPLGPVFERRDDPVPSGMSQALELMAALSRRAGLMLDERADALLAAYSGALSSEPILRLSGLRAARRHLEGEVAPVIALAGGHVRAAAARDGARITVTLAKTPGWHVNAADPLIEELIPTALSGDGLTRVDYPAPVVRRLGFIEADVAFWEGVTEIRAETAVVGPVSVTLETQACSDEICLAPERITFRLR